MSNFLKFSAEFKKGLTEKELKPDVLQADSEGNTIPYKVYDGIRYPNFPFVRRSLSELPSMKIRDDDILLTAFVKSGTNWVWEIASMILQRSADPIQSLKFEGFLEFMPQKLFDGYISPRVLSTHILPHLIPREVTEKKIKLIFILRNPKDIAQSFYHHSVSLPMYGYKGTFNGFFEMVMQDKNDYGSWFDYTLAWEKFLQSYPQDRQLILYYEDLKEDLVKYVKIIAKFLEVSLDDAVCEAISDHCGFRKMRAAKMELTKDHETTLAGFEDYVVADWYRKGAVGEWKNHFTVAQNERFDAKFKEKIGGCSFKFRYEI